MNLFFSVALIVFLFGCYQPDPKFVRKEISNKGTTIKWYYYSYISNQSPDYVTIEKDGITKEIYKGSWEIVNVGLKDSSITLRLLVKRTDSIFKRKIESQFFGYKIILDTTSNYEEIMLIPDGKRE